MTARLLFLSLAIAVAAHVVTVESIPYLVSWLSLRKVNLTPNTLHYGKVKLAPKDTVPYDNAYNMSSFVVYDVSETPVRIHAEVPDGVPYWSISVNGYNTDQLFVANDRDLATRGITLVIAKDGQSYAPQSGEQLVRSPSSQGMVLVRMLLPKLDDPALVERMTAVQQRAAIEIVSAP